MLSNKTSTFYSIQHVLFKIVRINMFTSVKKNKTTTFSMFIQGNPSFFSNKSKFTLIYSFPQSHTHGTMYLKATWES